MIQFDSIRFEADGIIFAPEKHMIIFYFKSILNLFIISFKIIYLKRLFRYWINICFFTLLSIFSLVSSAQLACSNLFREKIIFENAEYLRTDITELTSGVDQWLGSLRPTKTTVKIFSILDLRDSYNKHTDNEIVIGTYGLTDGRSMKFKAVFVHEYAHAVLYEYFKKYRPEINLAEVRQILRSYNELFADLVAALYFADPDVMSKAVTYKSTQYLFRTFNIDIELRDWKSPDTPGSPAPFYTELDPTRHTIWKLYIEKGKQNPEVFIKSVLDGIADNMQFRKANEDISHPSMDNQTINSKFLEFIILRLQK